MGMGLEDCVTSEQLTHVGGYWVLVSAADINYFYSALTTSTSLALEVILTGG